MRARSLKAGFLAAAIAIAPAAAPAEDMIPLRQAVDQGATEFYPYLRCAGLFATLTVFTGATEGVYQLDPATIERLDHFGREFTAHSVILTMKVGYSEDKAIEIVRNTGSEIAQLYEAMFVETHAKTGGIFDSAGMVEDDLKFCAALMQSYGE